MLKKYREKRDFSKTPEPTGKTKIAKKQSRPLTFVVQEHAATRLHFDFRLEANGVLLSWAVPKGPSLNPQEKRLAVMTEDHPLDYAGFEGIIPSGYGAGEVIVWDEGTYAPIDSGDSPIKDRIRGEQLIRQGLSKGKFSFCLEGKKLKGIWTLIRMKQKEKEWLLIKHEDKFANEDGHPWRDDSVLSGKTLSDFQSKEKAVIKKKPIKSGKQKSPTLAIKASPKQKQQLKKRTKGRPTKTKQKTKFPKFEPPMLATLTADTFVNKEWLFEPKLDGIRAISYINNGQVTILSRRGLLLTNRYPGLVSELSHYKKNLVIDGEIVAFDKNHRPSFEKLQERSGLTKLSDIEVAEKENPIKYYVFDITFLEGKDLRKLPLRERKTILHKDIRSDEYVEIIEELGSSGDAAFQACIENGLEGIVAKRLDSTYQSNYRSTDWLKVKATFTDEFLICGYTQGTGSRKNTFGALILGEYNSSNKLIHVCSVGTGFNDKTIAALLKIMKPLKSSVCPFEKKPQGIKSPVWLKPQLVAEVKFAERTKDRSLRIPVFLHLREDIDPKTVKPKRSVSTPPLGLGKNSGPQFEKNKSTKKKSLAKAETVSNKAPKGLSEIIDILSQLDNNEENLDLLIEGKKLRLSHLNKPFWPSYEGHAIITKRDYLVYLANVSPWLLPHLKDRLITLIRFPQGIKGIKFFQKHWDENLPDFVATAKVFTEHENRDQNFLLCNNLSTLLWLGQIADLELHTTHTRVNPLPDAKKISDNFTGSIKQIDNSLLNYPDFMVFDLDPYLYSGRENKGEEPELHRKGFKKTCDVAFWLKEILDELSLTSYVKTSGKTGLHIYVPIKRNVDYDSVREFSQIIGKHILEKHPETVTMDWSVTKRKGKVFFDHNMNARSKSLASIYSPRISKEAMVSTPIAWQELTDIYPEDFTLESIPDRLKEVGDLWSTILDHKNDLLSAIDGAVKADFVKNKQSRPISKKKAKK